MVLGGTKMYRVTVAVIVAVSLGPAWAAPKQKNGPRKGPPEVTWPLVIAAPYFGTRTFADGDCTFSDSSPDGYAGCDENAVATANDGSVATTVHIWGDKPTNNSGYAKAAASVLFAVKMPSVVDQAYRVTLEITADDASLAYGGPMGASVPMPFQPGLCFIVCPADFTMNGIAGLVASDYWSEYREEFAQAGPGTYEMTFVTRPPAGAAIRWLHIEGGVFSAALLADHKPRDQTAAISGRVARVVIDRAQ